MTRYVLAYSAEEVETEQKAYDTVDECNRLRAAYPYLRNCVVVKVETSVVSE